MSNPFSFDEVEDEKPRKRRSQRHEDEEDKEPRKRKPRKPVVYSLDNEDDGPREPAKEEKNKITHHGGRYEVAGWGLMFVGGLFFMWAVKSEGDPYLSHGWLLGRYAFGALLFGLGANLVWRQAPTADFYGKVLSLRPLVGKTQDVVARRLGRPAEVRYKDDRRELWTWRLPGTTWPWSSKTGYARGCTGRRPAASRVESLLTPSPAVLRTATSPPGER